MNTMKRMQRGAAAVEMAIVSLIFLSLLLAVIDLSRWLYAFNAASEATRLGARLAAICARDITRQNVIRMRMQPFVPELTAARAETVIGFDYQDANGRSAPSCGSTDCRLVSVWLQGHTIRSIAWFLPGEMALPAVRSSVSRESMEITEGVCSV
ncbi:MAG: hypothetical protein RI906_15 [Pseudomonadota bacterium]|jgi:hypothetical protein